MIEEQFYTAKEAMQKLNKPTTTFYREVKEGQIPFIGKKRNMKFPKEAIDALAEIEAMEEDQNEDLIFTHSTIADAWRKQEITRQPYEDADAVPFKTLLAWRKRNDEISMHVEKGDQILGWTTFLPLDENVILALVEDKIREKDIPLNSIRKWTDKNLSVYIPIIEVIPSNDPGQDKEVAAFLIRKTIKWALTLSVQCNIKNWYGIGVTPEGQRLLEELGFKLINNQDEGIRKSYILGTDMEPTKLVRHFLAHMGEKNDAISECNDSQPDSQTFRSSPISTDKDR